MNRNRLIFVGCAALAVAALISVVVYRIVNAAIASAHTANTMAVVATVDLPVGTLITSEDVKMVPFAASSLPSGYFKDPQVVVGRGVITSIAKNELVLSSRIAAENAGGGLPAMIPDGKRAVAVKVNDVIGVAGFALPGTKVDVVVTGSGTSSSNPGDVTATTVLQNVQVLAAGQKLQNNADGKPEEVQVITLLVTPEEAQKLALATQEGKIQLTLRNPLDTKAPNVSAIRNAALYGATPKADIAPAVHARATKPAKIMQVAPVQMTYTVETIRGDKKEIASFKNDATGKTGEQQ